MKHLIVFLFLLFLNVTTFANRIVETDSISPDISNSTLIQDVDTQFVNTLDSLILQYEKAEQVNRVIKDYENKLLNKEMSFDWNSTTTLIRGELLTLTNKRYRSRDALFEKHKSNKLDYLPAAAPLAATWMLKASGLESRSKTKRMTMANALALGIGLGAAKLLKHTVEETRPDMRDNRSMPSGHATLAFISATILDREYGHYSPWISVGGYATAMATQFHRIHQNAHYLNDVVIGAGIGVVSTNFAYYITDCILGKNEVNKPFITKSDVLQYSKFLNRPTAFSLYSNTETGYNLINGDNYDILDYMDHDFTVRSTSSLGTALEFSYFFNKNMALEAMSRITQTKIQIIDNTSTQYTVFGDNVYQYHIDLGVKYSFSLGLEQRIGLRAFTGYRSVPETDFKAIDTGETAIKLNKDNSCEIGGGINVDFLSGKKYVSGISCDYTHVFSSLLTNRWVLGSYFKIIL